MPSSACRALTLGILAALSVTAKPLPVLTPVTAAAADRGFIASLPLAFEANEGQFAETIRYAARGAGHAFAFSADGARVALAGGVGAFSMRFEHANRTSPVGEWPLPGTANYFLGADPEAWRTDVPTYRRVRYPEVYPGIDAVFYGNGRQLEYDLIVEPGGDPRQPRLSFSGVDEVRLSAEGELELAVRERTLRFTRPVAYQVIDGRRQPVAAAYRLEPDGIRFEVGPYDRRRVLTIDPVFVYSTYLGGSGEDMIFDVAADPAGSVYVTGHTFSTDFPVTSSALQSSKAPGVLAFVSKIDRAGTALIYSTYIGGDTSDGSSFGLGTAVDPYGNAYVSGMTNSSTFPTTAGAHQRTHTPGEEGGEVDAFALKLSASESRLVYSTLLGGSGGESAGGLAIDDTGHAFVGGGTSSSDFPVTAGALDGTNDFGNTTGYLAKLTPTGGAVYVTYLTGVGQHVAGVALDQSGNAYVAGRVASGLAVTPGAFQPTPNGAVDAFVAKINATGTAFVYATYLGSERWDEAGGIAIDRFGRAYVAGRTFARDTFPVSDPAFRRANTGEDGTPDAFLTVLLEGGDRLWYSTLIGGTDSDWATSVDVDQGLRATVAGATASSDFPVRNAIQPGFLGRGGADRSHDAFVASFVVGGYDIVYSTYLGGHGDDSAQAVSVATAARTTVAGHTRSADFPVHNALDGDAACSDLSCGEGFITQIAPADPGTISSGDVVLYAADATTLSGAWRHVADETAAGGERLHHPDAGAAKITTPLANPTNYFEVTAHVEIERPYTLWIRGKAQNDHFNNDSVYVQFSTAVSGDNPDEEPYPNYVYRIGTTNALDVVLEDCRRCGLKGWAWTNSGYGFKVSGPTLTFDTEEQTIRIQTREDGVSIDQIVLAPYSDSAYAAQAPGFQKEDDTILPRQADGRNQDVVLYPGVTGGADYHGAWTPVADSTAADGFRLAHPDAGAAKLTTPLASPTNYFDVSFDVPMNAVPYRIWIRGKADRDHWSNDSVYVQFSDAMNDDDAPIWQIGSTSATTYVLEDCHGCGVQGWGWNDNGYGTGVLGPPVIFGSAGTQRLRIQTREDGLSIDQIALSPVRYSDTSPGATKNDTTIVGR